MLALKILGWGSVALLELVLVLGGHGIAAILVLLFVAGWTGW